MKKFVLASLLLSSFGASAMSDFTCETLALIIKENAVNRIRVYNNQKSVSTHESKRSSTDINAEIDTSIDKNVTKVVLKKKTRGKIVLVESDKDYWGVNNRIYVSFDNACNDKSCAYLYSPSPNSCYGNSSAQFRLVSAPAISGQKTVKLTGSSAKLLFNKSELIKTIKSKKYQSGVE